MSRHAESGWPDAPASLVRSPPSVPTVERSLEYDALILRFVRHNARACLRQPARAAGRALDAHAEGRLVARWLRELDEFISEHGFAGALRALATQEEALQKVIEQEACGSAALGAGEGRR